MMKGRWPSIHVWALTSMRLKQTAYFAFVNCVLAWTSANAEISCPAQPQQASKDSAVAVEAAVGKLGPFKATDVKTNVNTTTADLLGKLPQADQVYLRQMLFAAFCTAVRDDPTVTNKNQLIREYGNELLGKSPPSSPPSRPSGGGAPAYETIQSKTEVVNWRHGPCCAKPCAIEPDPAKRITAAEPKIEAGEESRFTKSDVEISNDGTRACIQFAAQDPGGGRNSAGWVSVIAYVVKR